MSETKHTPGPWCKAGSVIRAVGGAERKVADVLVTDAEGVANAKLVVAAPDLLDALEMVIQDMAPTYHDCTDDGLQECAWCIARAAIARAKGEQP